MTIRLNYGSDSFQTMSPIVLIIDDASNESDSTASWLVGVDGPACVILLLFYGIILVTGVGANISLLAALCAQQGRTRSPMLFAVCLADLVVCGCSVPLSVLLLVTAAARRPWQFSLLACRTTHFMQIFPVAASTLSLMGLAMHRYLTVKQPRLFLQNGLYGLLYAAGPWLAAAVLTLPELFVRQVREDDSHCADTWTPTYVRMLLLVFIFAVPAVAVVGAHLGVRAELCALSLTARAAHGELPLPLPLLHRSDQVVILTGMEPPGNETIYRRGSAEGAEVELEKRARCMRLQIAKTQQQNELIAQQENDERERRNAASQLSHCCPQSSTLRSRRRLANMLVAVAVTFAACWTPHVLITFLPSVPDRVSQFALLLGHAHSALNPVVYWALNHQSLGSIIPCAHFKLREHLRLQTVPPNPSSTNEAALGPFNPRYIKARPSPRRPPSSSHYLY